MKLSITDNTFFKQGTGQAVPDDTDNNVFVREGLEFSVESVEWLVDINHLKIKVTPPGFASKITWYCFADHVEVTDEDGNAVETFNRPANTEPDVNRTLPTDTVKVKNLNKGAFVRVGNTKYYLSDPIIEGGNFTWDEATHCGTRVPNKEQVETIKALAKRLQPYRNAVDEPFEITSWFRPEPFNRRAGGASRSRHLSGGAVDIKIRKKGRQLTGKEMYEQYFKSWKGGVGIYRHLPFIMHLDISTARKWGF